MIYEKINVILILQCIIQTNYKIDVTKNKRASIRLQNECEKLKKLLSSNSGKMTMNIECLMDDKDVRGFMLRSVFKCYFSETTRNKNILPPENYFFSKYFN